MDGESNFEAAALRLIRNARQTCEQLGNFGYRFVAVADWVEHQIPRVRHVCKDAVHAAIHELTRPRPPDDQG